MAEFRMPSLGSDMVEGTLLEWRVKPGDRVRRRDVIAVVDTDKAAIEIEVFEDGIVEVLLVQPGQKVPVGTAMAVIRAEGAEVPTAEIPGGLSPERPTVEVAPERPMGAEQPPAPASAPPIPLARAAAAERIKASPYARRLAAQHSIDLGILRGTGPRGSISAADVQRAMERAPGLPPRAAPGAPVDGLPPDARGEWTAPAPPPSEKPAAVDTRAAMRRAIAAAVARSNREIPHYYLQTRIDMSRTLRWLES
ncbi:MAG: E3 binding domain-containing protein, partial [Candidatus Eisenbacteria bacterium]|nr:E3 binding domain-containing protein [Candidatus Eisenbacteria bacterium]